jgi:FkbM family methyltransferase
MLKTTLKKEIKKRVPDNVLELLKSTFIYKALYRSVGDWRYPFMAVGWIMAAFFYRQRRVVVDSVEFTLPCENWITHFRWYLFKKKEPEVRRYINEYLNNSDIHFDIGANIGVFSVYAAKRHSNLKVYCFEPEYSNLNALKNNITKNNLTDQVKIFGVGIGNFVGFSELHIQDMTTGSAAHTESKDKITTTDEGYPVIWTEGIISVTIDYICEQLGVVPNTLKIDTDGNEDKILDGAKNTLNNDLLKSLVIEIPDGDKGKYCCNVLKGSGFERVWYDDNARNQIWKRRGKKL